MFTFTYLLQVLICSVVVYSSATDVVPTTSTSTFSPIAQSTGRPIIKLPTPTGTSELGTVQVRFSAIA